MGRIKIVTDSSCDMPRHYKEELNIAVAPLMVTLDGKTYREWYDILPGEFMRLLTETKDFPKTSLVTPELFLEEFKKAAGEGYDTIITITIPAAASGTFQSAQIAREMALEEFPGLDIEIVDSRFLCYVYGNLVVEAAKLALSGADKQEILDRIRYLQRHSEVYFAVDTLEYLRRGGRINAVKAAVGTMLNLKPILTLKNGLVEQVENVRGSKRVMSRLIELLQANKGDAPYEKVFVGHGAAPEKLKLLEDKLTEAFGATEFEEFEVGVVVGAHAGPGFLADFVINPEFSNDWLDEGKNT